MIPLNYHHLYYFWTAAKLGSISGAAEQLYLSQSTLSGQLKELEESFKMRLLVRGRAGVTLTPEGREVFERCARIFQEGSELADLVKKGTGAPPTLRLGVRPTVTREVALRLMRFARAAGPECRVALVSGEPEALLSKLRQNAVDLVVANQDLSAGTGRELRGRLVSELPVYFVASRKLRRSVKRFPADLAKTPMLLRPAENSVRKQVDAFLAKKGVVPLVEADSEDVDLLRRLALEGRGVTALSGLAIEAELKSGRLAALHSSPIGVSEPIWFVCQTQPRGNPAVRALVGRIMDDFSIFGKAPAVTSRLG